MNNLVAKTVLLEGGTTGEMLIEEGENVIGRDVWVSTTDENGIIGETKGVIIEVLD